MKKFWRDEILMLIGMILFFVIYFTSWNFKNEYHFHKLADIVLTDLNTKSGLRKYAYDRRTYHKLAHHKIRKVTFVSDNQGGDEPYYIGKINHHDYGITFTKYQFGKKPKLLYLQDTTEMPK